MGFRLVPKSVTLNDLKRVMVVIVRYFSHHSGTGSSVFQKLVTISRYVVADCQRILTIHLLKVDLF